MRALLLMVFCLIAVPAPAATVEDLYVSTVPVAGRGDAAREQAIRQALRQVLVKVTGDRAAAGSEAAQPLLDAAPALVQRFQYLESESPAALGPGELMLRVWFDGNTVEQRLRQAGLPVWSKERPAVLAWVAIGPPGQRRWLDAEAKDQAAAALRQRAAQRGLPLVLPLMDLEDSIALRDAEPAADTAAVTLASRRYGADAVATAVVTEVAPGLWEARWGIADGDRSGRWTTMGELPALTLEEGVDWIADRLAGRYARRAAGSDPVVLELQIEGVRSVADYARVQAYLAGLDGTLAVSPRLVEADRVRFRVMSRGGSTALGQSIALGDVLVPVADTPGRPAYRLLPR